VKGKYIIRLVQELKTLLVIEVKHCENRKKLNREHSGSGVPYIQPCCMVHVLKKVAAADVFPGGLVFMRSRRGLLRVWI
jgi:hypothetical protein